MFKITSNSSFEVKIDNERIKDAKIVFNSDVENMRQLHAYIDRSDHFEIIFDNKNGALLITDYQKNLNIELTSDNTNEGFVDKISGKRIQGSDWINEYKINKIKYVILSAVMNEVLSKKKLFSDPIKVLQKKDLDNHLLLSISRLKKNGDRSGNVSPNYIPAPCSGKCKSQVHYAFDRDDCCTEASQEVNSSCCSNSYCIGCCTTGACNWSGVSGDFLGICTVNGTACTSSAD